MQSQLTVRLSEDLDRGISDMARKLHLKRSDIVRIALERFIGEAGGGEGSPYDKVKGLIGSVSSGVPDLGEAHRMHLAKTIRRHAQRPS